MRAPLEVHGSSQARSLGLQPFPPPGTQDPAPSVPCSPQVLTCPVPALSGGSVCQAQCSSGVTQKLLVFLRRVSLWLAPGSPLEQGRGRREGEGGDRSSREAAVGMPCPAFCHRLPAACQCGLAGLLLQGTSDVDHSACPWSLELLGGGR